MQRIRKHRCFVVLDSAGEPLRRGVRGRPNLVLPNLREAEDLVGHEFHDDQDLVDATGIVCEMGARNVIFKTQYGCVARFQVGRKQRVFRASVAPLETVVSTVGSGDAFLAGFISARFRKLDLPECLRHGLAAGAANTQRYGAGVLDAGRSSPASSGPPRSRSWTSAADAAPVRGAFSTPRAASGRPDAPRTRAREGAPAGALARTRAARPRVDPRRGRW